ncbi:hypothetical protein HDV05_001409, partial [Chytridiales sp. JEL 0842]
VEGIGYDFIPQVLERHNIDKWVKTDDKESFIMARRLIREEGLLCGGSSGAAMVGAIKAAKQLKKGQRCVVLLADSIRNYMTKHLNDDWMRASGFTDDATQKAAESKKLQWGGATIKDLHLAQAVTVPSTTSCADAIKIMQEKGFDQLPVTSSLSSKKMVGLVTLGDCLAKIASGRVSLQDPTKKAMFQFTKAKKFVDVTVDTPLSELEDFFNTNSSAVVTEVNAQGEKVVRSVVTKVDLLAFLVKQKAAI